MVKVTLKTMLTNIQNRQPPGTRNKRQPAFRPRMHYPFLRRRSLYLRQTTGAARMNTRLNNQPTYRSSSRDRGSHNPL
jgi:hypothetical protein